MPLDLASDSRAHLALFRHHSHCHSSSKTCKSTPPQTISTAIPLRSRRHSHTTRTLNHTHTPNRNLPLSLDIPTVLASLTSKNLTLPLTANTQVPTCIHTASTLSSNNNSSSNNSSSNNSSNISSINSINNSTNNIHSNILSTLNISNIISTPVIPACSRPSLRACHLPANLACSHHCTPACRLTNYPPYPVPSQCPQ